MSPTQPLQSFEISNRIPANQLAILLKVSSALAASLDLRSVLQTAIESAVDVLGLATGAIYLLDGDILYLGATTPEMEPHMRALLTRPEPLDDHPSLKESLRQMRPFYLKDACEAELTRAEAAICQARRLRSILFIPLLAEEKATGAMIVGTTGDVRAFTPNEIDLCQVMAYQVALAVANARLFHSVQQSNIAITRAYDATLLGWSLALEMRDQETQGHTLRVTQLTLDLARKMGVPEPELAHIRRGSLLHDIGKMSMPDTILKKRGPLNEEEWAVMHKHPELAFQFLKQIDFLSPALDIPLYHHERWDGSGYPRGLKDEEIPLSARIFAVADVFDALTADRPYREARGKDEALVYICEQAGKHFDPGVVKVFLELRAENP